MDVVVGGVGIGSDENINYDFYDYDGNVGFGFFDGDPEEVFLEVLDVVKVFIVGNLGLLFQYNLFYQIEGYWVFVDCVVVVVDDCCADWGDLYIVFFGGVSTDRVFRDVMGGVGTVVKFYYSCFNGVEWELLQVVVSVVNNIGGQYDDGVDEIYKELFEFDIVMFFGDFNVYLFFVGGLLMVEGSIIGPMGTKQCEGCVGRGAVVLSNLLIVLLLYFKVIGCVVIYEDKSILVGGFVYNLVYNLVNLQDVLMKNMIYIMVGDNVDGFGIGGESFLLLGVLGGFLIGQWCNVVVFLFGVMMFDFISEESRFVVKGVVIKSEVANDNGVFEGWVNDGGFFGFGEWGDDIDKVGLLVKFNVLGSDFVDNLFVVCVSMVVVTVSGSRSQSVSLKGVINVMLIFIKGVRQTMFNFDGVCFGRFGFGDGTMCFDVVLLGSYFQFGVNIVIVVENMVLVVCLVMLNVNTSGFVNELFMICYVIFDDDDDVGGGGVVVVVSGLLVIDLLQMELYVYLDNGLMSVFDICTFGKLIVDENDVFI